jgi:hypothetical protein
MSGQKDIDKLLREIERLPGWRVEKGTKHRVVYPPDKAHPPIRVPGSASDHRSYLNLRAQLRRAGAPV